MEVVHVVSCCIIFLLTVTASPEIPSKGKHMHMGDKSHTSLEDGDFPRFAEPVANVTVSVGRDALLACVVENLKGYKVAWVRVDTQTILSIHHNVISQNNRISLTYNDHRSWYLHIKEVEESDRGWYMCQVNTDPMRSRKGYLQVVVPPMIVEGMTSNDLVVREGLNVTLMCKARGYPEPYVMWRREDGEEMLIGGEHVNVVDGELLHITKVSRLHMAAYLCVASNGVPPSISKRVHLRVQFPPMLSIPNQLEGAYVGQDVILECHTEAYPASINYWTTERGDMIISDTSRAGDKYETTSTVNGYTKYMKLKIRNVGPNDFGTYRCVAKNSLGETDGNIKLDEMPTPTTAILSEMAMLNRSLGTMFSRKNGKRRNKNKLDSNSLPDYGVEEWRDGAGNAGDNNQAPMRNPPDAFHNSAGALAQHNLVGIIIQAIKMQSLGIFKRLTNFVQTINDNEILENIEVAVATILKTTIPQADVHKMRKYFAFATRQGIVKKWIKSTVSSWREQWKQEQQLPQLGYKTSAKTRKLCKNLIKENKGNEDTDENENEYKTFKHFSIQETHVSRCDNKHDNNQSRKWSTSSHHLFQTNNQTKMFLRLVEKGNGNANIQPANRNLFIEHFYVSSRFEQHIKQQEILYKFNNLYVVTTNKFKTNTPINCKCSSLSSLKLFANFIYCLIILPLSVFALSLVVNLLPTALVKRFKRLCFHSCYTHNLMLKCLKAYVNSIWWHIVYMANNMVKKLTSVYTKFNLNLNSIHSSTLQTTSKQAKAVTATSAVSAVLTITTASLSSSLTTQSLVTTITKTTLTTSSSCSPILSSPTTPTSSSSSSCLSSSQVTASALSCSTLLFCR